MLTHTLSFVCICNMSYAIPPLCVCVTVCVLGITMCEQSGYGADLAAIPLRTFDLGERFFFSFFSPSPLFP